MRLGNDARRWGAISMLLHWVIAGLIVFMFGLGKVMVDLGLTPQAFAYYKLHKSLGVVVLALVVLRLAWRLAGSAPPLPEDMPRWERWAAHLGHLALYGLILAIPLSGWVVASASPLPSSIFGLVDLPRLIAPDEALAERVAEVHELLGHVLLVVVLGHVAAALKHHFIDKNTVLVRMLPGRFR